jgi:hypothetical protein
MSIEERVYIFLINHVDRDTDSILNHLIHTCGLYKIHFSLPWRRLEFLGPKSNMCFPSPVLNTQKQLGHFKGQEVVPSINSHRRLADAEYMFIVNC